MKSPGQTTDLQRCRVHVKISQRENEMEQQKEEGGVFNGPPSMHQPAVIWITLP